jgi:hypothetical protein
MFDIVCSVDHSPDGAPAGKVVARVLNSQDWLDQYKSAYPNCHLSAIPVEAPVDSAHHDSDESELTDEPRRRHASSDHPRVLPAQPVYPRART